MRSLYMQVAAHILHVLDPLVRSLRSVDAETVTPILVGTGLVLALLHMAIGSRLPRYRSLTLEEIRVRRHRDGRPIDSTNEEDELAVRYLTNLFQSWDVVSEGDGGVLRGPARKHQLFSARRTLDMVQRLAPTRSDVIDRMNELGEVVHVNATRRFAGSKLLLWVAAALLAVLSWRAWDDHDSVLSLALDLWWLWGGMLFYVPASFAPRFLIDRRLRTVRSGSLSQGMFAVLASTFLSIPGEAVADEDEDGSCVGMLIGIVLVLVGFALISAFTLVFGLINYARNHIFYI